MSAEYKDYYKILGVTRADGADAVKAAYRKLARKYHPDMHPDAKKAEMSEKFKDINEAYDVLSDPKKKNMYDSLGPDWDKAGPAYAGGQPRGAQGFPGGFGGQNFRYSAGGANNFSGFSDFFNSIFGGGSGFSAGGAPFDFDAGRETGPGSQLDIEAELTLPLREAFAGGQKTLAVPYNSVSGGRRYRAIKNVTAKLPGGINDGATIKLKGQGISQNGRTGDLYIKVRLLPDPGFRLDGLDLETTVPVPPWTAALGGETTVATLDSTVRIKVPENTPSGKKLKIKGHGYGKPAGPRGDLYAIITIANPEKLTTRQKTLYEQLAENKNA
ncbi:MAG: J domain-containing protein [Elusimicrobiaceae bacterium]|nr:J domain-containing protein [Elusimicrobiaceae bacterium]